MTNFLDVNRSCTTLLRKLGIFILINVFLMQAFGDEPTNRTEADRDKIFVTTNLVDTGESKPDEFYTTLKSDQASPIHLGDNAKQVEKRIPQGSASAVIVSANLPIIGSVLKTIDKKVGSKVDDLQKWFASGSGGTGDAATCEHKIPASFDPGYVHAGNEENSDDCVGEFRPLDDHDKGPGGVTEHSCPAGTQGYYCSGDGELVEEDDQFFCVYKVSCDD